MAASLAEHARLHEFKVELFGLPVEEWAGPGYGIGALFDPYVLAAKLRQSAVYLEWPEAELPGITRLETRVSQKEKIAFKVSEDEIPVIEPSCRGLAPEKRPPPRRFPE